MEERDIIRAIERAFADEAAISAAVVQAFRDQAIAERGAE